MSLSALGFAFPWALVAFVALPVIWWLLRLTPPAPLKRIFPPLRLLLGVRAEEESSAKTPPWLLILRLVLAAAVILAAAGPNLDQSAGGSEDSPVLLVVDDGWASASSWDKRRQYMSVLAARAARQNQAFAVLTTALSAETEGASSVDKPGNSVELVPGNRAPALVAPLAPKAWSIDRKAAADALRDFQSREEGTQAWRVVWLSNGLTSPGTELFLETLQAVGPTAVVAEPTTALAKALRTPVIENGEITVTAVRADARAEETVWLRAFSSDGRIAVREQLTFGVGESEADATLGLPIEVANTLTRLDLEDGQGSGAGVGTTVLLDERWRRRPVGLVVSEGRAELPLLSSIYYLERALRPFSDVREDTLLDLLKRRLSVMILADPGALAQEQRTALDTWVENGGVAVWFAGPLMAEQTGGDNTPPLPVELREGDRVLGGAMSWSRPQRLKDFDVDSPFHGLELTDDVTVRRQVLARPGPEVAAKTWARLSDDTPLVTADRQGAGWRILFHTTANTQWSDLALSGVYVEMLRRIVGLSQGVVSNAGGPPLEPLQTLDAFGRLGPAPLDAQAIGADDFTDMAPSALHPPGLYGRGDERRALNLAPSIGDLTSLGPLPDDVAQRGFDTSPSIDLRPVLLILAMVLALVDMLASLFLRGLLRPARVLQVVAVGSSVGLTASTLAGHPAFAQSTDDVFALQHSNETRLVYLKTGNSEVDRVSQLGLTGLSLIVRRRTAAELATPIGVNPDQDELAFFPMLYWPVVTGASDLSDRARSNINRFMRNGGTILFDTQTQGGLAAGIELRELAETLDIPPLIQVPTDHVLTRSFYLIQEFPGRWAGGGLWIERAGARVNDGVSPVIAGSHNWAAAWALDEQTQRPMFPVVPGGERQREIAYRFGINLVMYTLTGNYKGDQVHLPAIIRRLGQ